MANKSSIEWTDSTWTPIRARVKQDAAKIAAGRGYSSLIQIATRMAGRVGPHCEHVSPGCELCYSDTNNGRCLPHNGTGLPFDRRSRDLVDVFIDEKILLQPLRWKQGRRVFVCSQTDLFAEFVPDELIDRVFAVMALCPQHTFQVLTKRPERMLKYFADMGRVGEQVAGFCWDWKLSHTEGILTPPVFPLSNVWMGVSVENQKYADERIPLLFRTPAAIRFVSYEPAIGPVDFSRWDNTALGEWRSELDWIIVGGESGPGARPFDIEWARKVVMQCTGQKTAVFVKQLGAKPLQALPGDVAAQPLFPPPLDRKGGEMSEWPPDLRVRQFPTEQYQD